jgi:hypothetical protein
MDACLRFSVLCCPVCHFNALLIVPPLS